MNVRTSNKAAPAARGASAPASSTTSTLPASVATPGEDMSTKEYAKALKKLHVELVKLQLWVQHTGAKVCIVFEGRDGAGKGGTIKALTERVSPRVFRVIALPAPTEREKSQMYVQRYIKHLPAAGEIVIFDRSWYNRAGVERVMGFCTPAQADRFLMATPLVEKAFVESGIILLKYWLEVSPEEQTRRLKSRFEDGRKIWKLTADGPEVVQPLVRLLARTRRDVRRHRHRLRALARRAVGPQEDRAPEHHRRHPEENSVQGLAAREAEAARPAEAGGLCRVEASAQVHRPGLLTARIVMTMTASDLTLRDGRVVHLRDVTPADESEFFQAFERMSDNDRYMRFMRVVRAPDAQRVRATLASFPEAGIGIVATVPGGRRRRHRRQRGRHRRRRRDELRVRDHRRLRIRRRRARDGDDDRRSSTRRGSAA